MPTLPVVVGTVVARSGVTLLARLRGQDGRLVTRASLSSIAWAATDLTAAATLGSGTFALTTVHDDLQQNDPRWARDSARRPGPDGAHGYNWLATLAATLVPLTTTSAAAIAARPAVVQVDVVFTPVTGEPWRVVWKLTPQRAFA